MLPVFLATVDQTSLLDAHARAGRENGRSIQDIHDLSDIANALTVPFGKIENVQVTLIRTGIFYYSFCRWMVASRIERTWWADHSFNNRAVVFVQGKPQRDFQRMSYIKIIRSGSIVLRNRVKP